MRTILSFIFVVAFCLDTVAVSAQTVPIKKFELTIDNIMRGPGLVGYEPTGVRWSPDGRKIYFRWKQAGEPLKAELSTYEANADGTGLRKLSDEEVKLLPPTGGDLSDDKKTAVYAENGDIFLYDLRTGQRRQLTKTTDVEGSPRFSADHRSITFTRQNNLYAFSLDSNLLEQLTDIRAAGVPAPTAGPGGRGGVGGGRNQQNQDSTRTGTDSQEALKKEERGLFDAIRERAEKREEGEKKRKESEKDRRKFFQLTGGQNAGNMSLSPDGKFVIVMVNESGVGSKTTIVPNFVTESGYTEDIPGRTKVGDIQGRNRVAILSVATGDSKWVDHGQRLAGTLPVAGAGEKSTEHIGRPEHAATGQETKSAQGGPPPPRERDVQLSQPIWSDDGKNAVLSGRSVDNKNRWIMQLDPATGKTRILASIKDDAWVGGPGGFSLGWMPDNRRVFFQSERDGFSHLYTVSIEGGEPKQLTSGQFEVSDVRVSEDKTKFYFTSSEGSFFERNLYSMGLDGGARTKLTSMPGNNQTTVSPDQTKLAIVRSFANKPPELYVAPNKTGDTEAEIKQVTSSPTDEWKSYNWITPPIVSIKARDGATVYGRLYKPANFKKGGPAVVFVHGAGYLQNVHNWWSTYYREYMFHHLLMEKGYAVLDIDYRGSAGYGRDWRTGIYRHMGGKDLTDHVDAAQYLVNEHGVNAQRIGIYGGSYGGFITLMAMFTTPDVFAAGAALRPVTDWAHYNNGYTANILNLPQSDQEAYRRSSPIYHAAGLKGALLIAHGMVDVNVHYQDSVRLAQKLIELRKENWELAGYPVEDHGFEQPTSWADEYKRIFKLFETNLKAPTPLNSPSKKKK
jgi:dipeptidyl aminopeptidase/acylaminoacyl peptidase